MSEFRQLFGDPGPSENNWFTNPASSSSSTVFYSLDNFDDQLNNDTGDTYVVGDDAVNQNPANFVFNFNGPAPVNIQIFPGPTYYGAPEAHPNPFGQYNNYEMEQRVQSGQMAQPPPFQAHPTVDDDDIWNNVSVCFSHFAFPSPPQFRLYSCGSGSSTNGATSSQSSLHGSAVQAPVFPEPIFTPPTSAFPTISSTINNTTQRGHRGRGRPRGSSRIPRYQF